MRPFMIFFALLFLVAILPVAGQEACDWSQQRPCPIDTATTGEAFGTRPVGDVIWAMCPPGTPPRNVMGDGTYFRWSNVCNAGQHMGVIRREEGGVLQLQVNLTAGAGTIPSSADPNAVCLPRVDRNDVTGEEVCGSRDYFYQSFTIVGGASAAANTSGAVSGADTTAQSVSPEEADAQALVCTLLQTSARSWADDETRLTGELDAAREELAAGRLSLAQMHTDYSACVTNPNAECSDLSMQFITVLLATNRAQEHVKGLEWLLGQVQQQRGRVREMQTTLACPVTS